MEMTKTLQQSDKEVTAKTNVEDQEKGPQLSLFKNPLLTLYYFSFVVLDLLKKIANFALRNLVWISFIVAFLIVPRLFDHPYYHLVTEFDHIVYFVFYWVILGIASSIGLGTGLHTFVLYLGPYIAKVTMIANECNTISEYLPSRWNMKGFGACPAGERPTLSLLDILFTVQPEVLLWGLGTALGELPPYFVARAARTSGNKAGEVEEVENLKKADSFLDKIKVLMHKYLQKNSFITVLICAAIPNPFFDLAGITCGTLGIPFLTFFTAAAIGKAVFKAHLQTIFVIICFSNHRAESLLNWIGRNIPFLKATLSRALEKQKQTLHNPLDFKEGEGSLLGKAWNIFIIAMILFFVISLINSLANAYLEEKLAKNENQESAEKEPTHCYELIERGQDKIADKLISDTEEKPLLEGSSSLSNITESENLKTQLELKEKTE